MGCLSSKPKQTAQSAKDAPQEPERPKRDEKPKIYIAQHTWESTADSELSLKKGDEILVTDQSNSDWWKGKIKDRQGVFPSKFVVSKDKDLGPWYHQKCNRKDAERLLLDAKVGTFLIRPRETGNDDGVMGYSLSVRALQPAEKNRDLDIRHYKINVVRQGKGHLYYISDKSQFESLKDMVMFYKETDDVGLCIKLGDPLPVPNPVLNDLSVETADKWEIPRSEIALVEQLGSGQFGEVWLALWRGKTKVAVKTLKPNTMKVEAFLEEANLMKRVQHKHLVRLYAICSKGEPIYIITELAAKGCLLKFLREGEGRKFEFHQLMGMTSDIADAMVYLENLNYIHRDLAARNVLVDEHYSCKVCDFGLARCVEQDDTYTASKGSKFPIKWTAPEAIAYGHFSIKSDVWSFGIVIYEIVTKGRAPYTGMSNREVMEKVEQGYRMPCPEGCPDHLYKIMRSCWHSEPLRRPNFEYLFRVMSEYTAVAERQYG